MIQDFKAINEQIEILKTRGLTIDNEEVIKDFLRYNNYFRINEYLLTFQKNDKFIPSISMQDIMNFYRFDQELRSCLFNILTRIEVNIRSILTYYFTEKYGTFGYRDKNNFIETKRLHYEEVIAKIDKHVQRNIKNEEYLRRFVKIKEEIPFWAYIESFTFSDLQKFYAILQLDVQKNIAREFTFTSNNGYEIMSNNLKCLTFLRNICVHGARLLNRSFNARPMLSKAEKALSKNNPDNALLFGSVLIIKRLARPNDWKTFMKTLHTICDEYPAIDMSYYGFCNDWKERL